MARSDEILPGLGQKTLVPRLIPAGLGGIHLTQSEGYVLSRIDGRTTLGEICLLVPLKRDETLRILRRLRAEGVIEVVGTLEPMPPKEEAPPPPPPPPPPREPEIDPVMLLLEELDPLTAPKAQRSHRSPDLDDPSVSPNKEAEAPVEVITRESVLSRPPGASRTSGLIDDTRPSRRSGRDPGPAGPAGAGAPSERSRQSVPSVPPRRAGTSASSQRSPGPPGPGAPATPPPADDSSDLTPQQRQRIDEIHRKLSVSDAFALLGVSQEDDKKAVQRAYFKLSKEFHPDRYFQKRLGPYQAKIAAVFQALTEARDILVDEERRRRYIAGERD